MTRKPNQQVHLALSRHVLAAAIIDHERGMWVAYIDSVPGIDHAAEARAVRKDGDKLNQPLAEYLFRHTLRAINSSRKEWGKQDLRWRK